MSGFDAGGLLSRIVRPRERARMIAAALGVLVLAAAAVASHRYREAQAESLLQARALLNELRREEPALRAWRARNPPGSGYATPESLLAELSALVQSLELPLQRSTTAPDGSVTVFLGAARYERVLAWLDEIEQKDGRGLRIERLAITRTDTPGLVDVEVRVRGEERPPA